MSISFKMKSNMVSECHIGGSPISAASVEGGPTSNHRSCFILHILEVNKKTVNCYDWDKTKVFYYPTPK